MPTSPQKPAGMRMDPPPSPPLAMVTSPPATAAALPAEDPPVVRVGSQGLRVMPWRRDTDTLSPPNSLAVVDPTETTPAPVSRSTSVVLYGQVRSANTRDASAAVDPATG